MAALRALGHEVDDLWAGAWPRRITHHNLHQLIELPRRYRDVVFDRCKSKQYDVVHVNQPHAWLAAKSFKRAGLPGLFLNRSHGWETRAWDAVNRFGEDRRPLAMRIATQCLRVLLARHNTLVAKYSDGVVVETSGDREAVIEAGAQPKRVLVLEPGISELFLSSERPVRSERYKCLLHAASYSPHKAPEVVAKVFRQIASYSEFSLTWITEEKAHRRVRELLGDASRNVRLLSWVDVTTLKDELDAHGFFLQPSYFEGFSLAFVQAMARGCCVIGTPIDCMTSTIDNGINGYLCQAGDGDAMADIVLNSKEPDNRRVSEAAAATASNFTWQNTAQKLVDFCGTLQKDKDP